MAKKDKQEYSFMTRPLPKEAGRFNSVKRTFAGLNYRNTLDSGQWAWEKGVSTNEYPCLAPARKWEEEYDYYTAIGGNSVKPLSLHFFDNIMLIIYKKSVSGAQHLFVDRIDMTTQKKATGFIGTVSNDDNRPREAVAFNRFVDDSTVVNGKYVTEIIILPDKVYMPLKLEFIDNGTQFYARSDTEHTGETVKYNTFISAANSDKVYPVAKKGVSGWGLEYVGIDTGAMYCFTKWYTGSGDGYTYTEYYAHDGTQWQQVGKTGKSHTRDEFGYFALTEMSVDVETYTNSGAYVPTTDKVGDHSKTYYEKDDQGDYTQKTGIADYDDVSGLYVRTKQPVENVDKSKYYYNTSDSQFYTYDSRTNSLGNVVGWQGSVYAPVFPDMDHGTVYLARLFGVSGGKIYASGYNNYANWAFDIGDEHNDYSPWCSATGANTKAGGEFTAITSYQNHVIAFKKDFMHEIYNTKNPFTVHDVYACGCVSARTVQEVGGKLIFAAPEGIMIYTGSKPRLISYEINIDEFDHNCCSGSDGRFYYLYYTNTNNEQYPHRMFVYDTWTECWSEEVCEHEILGFAYSPDYGMYRLEVVNNNDGGAVYKRREKTNPYAYDWCCVTDLMTAIRKNGGGMTDISHIQRLTIMCDMSAGSELRAYLIYDDEPYGADFDADKARLIAEVYDREGRVNVRVVPRMSAHYGFRVRLEGNGYIKIFGMEIEQKAGGVRDVISGGLE